MINRKWLPTLALAIYLVVPSVTALGASMQQRFERRPPDSLRLLSSASILLPQRQTNIRIGSIGVVPNRRLSVISVLPRNETEFQYVYGRRPRGAEFSNMIKEQARSRSRLQPGLKFNSAARTSTGFDNYVRRSKAKSLILEGHNVNGRFYFADGVSRELADIDAFVKKNGKQAIYLSCDAQKYVPNSPATTRRINYREARVIRDAIGKGITGRGRSPINNPRRFDMNRVQQEINRAERRLIRNSKLKQSAAIGAAGGGTGYYLLDRWRKSKRR